MTFMFKQLRRLKRWSGYLYALCLFLAFFLFVELMLSSRGGVSKSDEPKESLTIHFDSGSPQRPVLKSLSIREQGDRLIIHLQKLAPPWSVKNYSELTYETPTQDCFVDDKDSSLFSCYTEMVATASNHKYLPRLESIQSTTYTGKTLAIEGQMLKKALYAVDMLFKVGGRSYPVRVFTEPQHVKVQKKTDLLQSLRDLK